jgi:ATP-dependent helicase HrpA
LSLPAPARFLQGRLSNEVKLALSRNPYRNVVELLDDCAAAAVDELMTVAGGLSTWDEAGFTALRDAVRGDLIDLTVDVCTQVRRVLAAAWDVEQRLARTKNPLLIPALADMRGQLAGLVYPGFVAATGYRRLPDLVRYLQGIDRRLDKLPENPARDRERMLTVQEIQKEHAALPASPQTREIRWMIEELRVNLFAQALGTAYPISDVRIYRAIDALSG